MLYKLIEIGTSLVPSFFFTAATNPTIRNKKVLGGGAAAVIALLYFAYQQRLQQRQRLRSQKQNENANQTKNLAPRKAKVAINAQFFRNLKKLLAIIIPSWKSREALLLLLHSIFLLLRTGASVYLAIMDGRIVKSLVEGNAKEFSWGIVWWLLVSLPIAYVNSMMKYLQGKLSTNFRSRLTRYVHDNYMSDATYYKIENLDTRIRNADQCITGDVDKFCNTLAELYSNLAKPSVDCIIYNAKLGHNVGFKGLMVMTACIHTGTFILRTFAPNFGRLIAEEQRLEGHFRYAHSRIIQNAEEIAFYNGANAEKAVLDEAYRDLIKQINKLHSTRLAYGTLEHYIVKYYWGALGFLICALPVFTTFGVPAGAAKDGSLTSRTQDFVTNKRLLMSTSDAFERIMYSHKEVSELAGYTHRVCEMLEVFEDMKNERYIKGDSAQLQSKKKGTVMERDDVKSIIVDNLSIYSPNGDLLIKGLTFTLHIGQHLLITGPNGCGKSSLFRILGGLWPVYEGTVTKPSRANIFYIPQRPYLSLGTLRDQVIYPDSVADARRKGITDEDLSVILETVRLKYIVDREGGWDARNDWKDVLSGGEKQRIAMARLFYHKPQFAILDECTSAVSIDVEGHIYTKAKECGISLMTVSHRPTLWKYHDVILQFDGNGGFHFGPINESQSHASGKLLLCKN